MNKKRTTITMLATISLNVPSNLVPIDDVDMHNYANDVLALVLCQAATPDIAIANCQNADVTGINREQSKGETMSTTTR
jgi:hypothetical protein